MTILVLCWEGGLTKYAQKFWQGTVETETHDPTLSAE
jgi:hypothetical protein